MIHIKKEHRSISTLFVERMIRFSYKKVGNISEKMINEFLKQIAVENAKEFVLPKSIKCDLEDSFGLIKLYVFNSDSKEDSTIYYFPGGGYVYRPNIHELKMIKYIAKRIPNKIVMIVYPLIPIVTVHELYTLLICYLKGRLSNKDIFLGDSAGGGLALGLAMELKKLGFNTPSKLFLLSPWLDVMMKNEESKRYDKIDIMLELSKLKAVGKVWKGDLKDTDYHVSPIYGDFNGLGKINMYIGTRELFYPDVMKLHKKLEKSRIEHELFVGEKMSHVWLSYPTREGKRDRDRLIKEIIGE